MSNLNVNPKERTLLLVGLLVLKETMSMSGYPPEVQVEMKAAIDDLVAKFNTPPPTYDSYGNPYG